MYELNLDIKHLNILIKLFFEKPLIVILKNNKSWISDIEYLERFIN